MLGAPRKLATHVPLSQSNWIDIRVASCILSRGTDGIVAFYMALRSILGRPVSGPP
jgi:hypothetical protein